MPTPTSKAHIKVLQSLIDPISKRLCSDDDDIVSSVTDAEVAYLTALDNALQKAEDANLDTPPA
jgi:uncharacterized protein with FMN-binding domain